MPTPGISQVSAVVSVAGGGPLPVIDGDINWYADQWPTRTCQLTLFGGPENIDRFTVDEATPTPFGIVLRSGSASGTRPATQIQLGFIATSVEADQAANTITVNGASLDARLMEYTRVGGDLMPVSMDAKDSINWALKQIGYTLAVDRWGSTIYPLPPDEIRTWKQGQTMADYIQSICDFAGTWVWTEAGGLLAIGRPLDQPPNGIPPVVPLTYPVNAVARATRAEYVDGVGIEWVRDETVEGTVQEVRSWTWAGTSGRVRTVERHGRPQAGTAGQYLTRWAAGGLSHELTYELDPTLTIRSTIGFTAGGQGWRGLVRTVAHNLTDWTSRVTTLKSIPA